MVAIEVVWEKRPVVCDMRYARQCVGWKETRMEGLDAICAALMRDSTSKKLENNGS